MSTPLGIAMAALSIETQPIRFEKFCKDIVSGLEGGRLVSSTSPTYDRGRDGRTIDPGGEITICCSLEDDVGEKAASDLKKVTTHGPAPAKLYFCSSQPLSEDARIKLTAAIRAMLPAQTSVEVFGSRQLAEAGVARFEVLLDRYYRTEIVDSLSALEQRDDGDDKSIALQLALTAVGHQDSVTIRHGLYRSALLSVLKDRHARNVAECSRDVSALLHLARGLPDAVVRDELQRLAGTGEVQPEGDRYALSPAGASAAEDLLRAASTNLLSGRAAVREQMEGELGYKLDDDHFSRIWTDFQDRITTFFFTRGQAMVAAIAALLEGEGAGTAGDIPEMARFVEELAAGAAATAADGTQAEQLRVAITDVFSDRVGPAFDWLVATAAAFLGICSLGLEATSGEQLRNAVSKLSLVPDTDVLLSFLGAGEPEHASVSEVLRRWKMIGGELLLANPVLLEAAHHAWIAPNDYRQVEHLLPGTEFDRVHLVRNAFVRAFATLMAQRKIRSKAQWPTYLRQFRGSTERDISALKRHLLGLLPFAELPGVSRAGRELRGRVKTVVTGNREAEARDSRDAKIIRDKAERDAELYVAIVEHARRLRNADPASTCVLMTSSGRLKGLEAAFPKEQHEELVLSIPVVLHMLSLVPGVALGINAMRALLFERRLGIEEGDLQRVILRTLRQSQEYSMPWASRTLLEGEVRKRIVEFARAETGTRDQRVERQRELEDAILDGKEPEAVATILSGALTAVGAETRADRELAEARRRIAELEKQLAAKRPRAAKAATPPKRRSGKGRASRTK